VKTPVELDVFRCGLDGINLIEASAGTGKTWNICGLYLRLLLERGLEVQQILVVTFTNAATAELRTRIRGRLAETLAYLRNGSAPAGDPFVKDLVAALEARGSQDRAALAARIDVALQTFDEAAVFTIHGFCQRALADTPFAAALPMALELVQDDADFQAEAVQDFWRRHIAADGLDPALAAFLLQKQDSPEKYAALLRRYLSKPLAECRWPDDLDRVCPVDLAALEATYRAARATWQARRETIVAALIEALPRLNANSYKAESVQQGAADWDTFFGAADPMAPLDIGGSKLGLFRAETVTRRTKKGQRPPADPFFPQAEGLLAARENTEQALEQARLKLIRDLLREAGTALRAGKREQRVVSFDDMLFNVYERLASGECPWLAPSLRTRFPAALIDEFQDTDPLQFSIFEAIYGGGEAPLFLVGDPKQAIYSFRHADLHTYLQARQSATAEYSLAHNQRATAGLISALNTLFSANGRAFLLPGLDYREAQIGAKPRARFDDRTQARADLQVWKLPGGDAALKKAEARVAATEATAAEIARLLAEAARGSITLGDRPLRPGDVAVLVRSHSQGSEIKHALGARGIGSVELSQASVFHSADAEEVERVLTAVLEPTRERLLRAALATELLGCDAAAVEAISGDEARLLERVARFGEYRETWLRRGVGFMFRQLLAAENVSARLLARRDGERRLTNLLHLGECLHQAAETHPAPDALMRWLGERRRDEAVEDFAQLRLESDQNLVQIVTIHKSKGLEYPVVFCPFLWDGRIASGGSAEGLEYHDPGEDDRAVMDFRGGAAGDDEIALIKQRIKLETAAETVRLIYVALTRAVFRCYLVAGSYTTMSFGRTSFSESHRSLLNWLVAGDGQAPESWLEGKPSAADIGAGWSRLAANAAPHLAVAPLPAATGAVFEATGAAPESLAALPGPGPIAEGWRIGSYSGLSHGATSEAAATDHDARIQPAIAAPSALPAGLPADDILRFPRGAAAGDCLHALFEAVDFTDRSTWEAAIETALAAHPQALAGLPVALQRERLGRMQNRLLEDVLSSELRAGLRLDSVALARRLTELEFNLPAQSLNAAELNGTLKALGYDVPRLVFGRLAGYLKGFIDLVFEHGGRFYILDWKSNHLGYAQADYGRAGLAEAMAEHGYHLQYLLYTVALQRYLRRRLPGYTYDSHFGGVLYLFVRGVRPGWQGAEGEPAGVFFHRPAQEAIERLDALIDPTRQQGAPTRVAGR
jgi:exodeoxyribonuclease V beta subunit